MAGFRILGDTALAFNGSGTFNRVHSWATDKTNTVVVTASRMDAEDDGFATGLSTTICKDGQTVTTARIPFVLGTSALAGSVSSVSYGFTNDLNTGLYSPAADGWALAAGGTKTLSSTATALTMTGTLTLSGALTVSSGGITVVASGITITAGGLSIAADGATVTGNSTIAGTLGVSSNFAVNTDKFTVAGASGNTVVAGTLGVTGAATITGALSAAGVISGPDGLVSAPAYTFSNDSNSGIFRVGADAFGLACGGAEVARFTASGVAVTGTLSSTGAATLSSTLAVTGAATLSSTLEVTGSITGTTVAGTMIASQADQESPGSSAKIVTPAFQHFHDSACKVWCNATIAAGLNDSYNMTSVTDTGVGDITFTIATDFSSTAWAGHILGRKDIVGGAPVVDGIARITTTGFTAGACVGRYIRIADGGASDPDVWFFSAFGDQ